MPIPAKGGRQRLAKQNSGAIRIIAPEQWAVNSLVVAEMSCRPRENRLDFPFLRRSIRIRFLVEVTGTILAAVFVALLVEKADDS